MLEVPRRRLVEQREDPKVTQIKGSFEKAMKLIPRPDEWILVVHCKYKNSIVDYINNELVTKVEGVPPAFSMIDQPELDFLLLAQPDLLDRFSRDDHFTKLVQLPNATELCEKSVTPGETSEGGAAS
ncbi:hypothetical protein ACWEVD_01850 [Nocardia thailandica]